MWKPSRLKSSEEGHLLDDYNQALNSCVLNPMKLGMKLGGGFQRKGQSCFASSELQSDLTVEVGGLTFYLHKFPLVSRSGRLNRLVFASSDGENDRISLDDIPGGQETFELVAKFSYGIPVELTANNISALRCAAEYLEMTEDLEEGNLISKTESFFSFVVLSSWKDSIFVLKSCEHLSPWAENLQIVRRCCDSIAWKACTDPRGVSWSFTGHGAATKKNETLPNWNDIKDTNNNNAIGQAPVPQDWWFEDVSILRIDHFVRVITAIKVKGIKSDLVGAAIVHYASKWLPGILNEQATPAAASVSISEDKNELGSAGYNNNRLQLSITGGQKDIPIIHNKEQRLLIESIISMIPQQKDTVPCSFLLRLLRLANMLNVTPALVMELEKRVGMHLEQATLSDLLIPCYSNGETLYDVDVVQRILEHFLIQEQTEPYHNHTSFGNEKAGFEGLPRVHTAAPSAKMIVARLLDSYLAEIARDTNLPMIKFQALADALPEYARNCDDGLYRAIDTYLKTHPALTEHERKRLCRIMDCQKLSLDACMHAAQNERLPLRTVVQVIFCELVRMRNSVAGNSLTKEQADSLHFQPPRKSNSEGLSQSSREGWSMAKKDIKTIKHDMEKMKAKFIELQHDHAHLQEEFEKLISIKQKSSSSWTSGWKKLGKLKNSSLFQNKLYVNDDTVQDLSAQMPCTPNGPPERKSMRWRNSVS